MDLVGRTGGSARGDGRAVRVSTASRRARIAVRMALRLLRSRAGDGPHGRLLHEVLAGRRPLRVHRARRGGRGRGGGFIDGRTTVGRSNQSRGRGGGRGGDGFLLGGGGTRGSR